MDYFKTLQGLLALEKEEDRRSYKQLTETLSVADRRASGLTWYPVAIRDTEIGRGDYLSVELERTTHVELIHQLRFGMSAALFSNGAPKEDRIEGIISYISGNRLKITLRTDELPEWSRNGKLGIDVVFDENTYKEMEGALKAAPALADKREEGLLVNILTGQKKPSFNSAVTAPIAGLNESQQAAVAKIIESNELAIVHGPPGTGKTTTLIQAIKAMLRLEGDRILVVAPSNAAVDLLTERLAAQDLNVVRVGNPARVSERLMALTLDSRIAAHPRAKEMKRLRKQAAEFRDMAQKYKRSFGPQEREQRKALYTEARAIAQEVERTEQYIVEDILAKAEVITATLAGANHYSVRHLKYKTVVIDEAGQALEPACWIPILKGRKLVMAGDHQQLPPTIKSAAAAKGGLSITLMEKCVTLHPEAVVLLQEQYRMHQTIMNFSSDTFYGGKVNAHHSVAGHLLFPGDSPLLFIDTAGCGYEEKMEGTGTSNEEEAGCLMRHLSALIDTLKTLEGALSSIAVISPYKHQVEALKQAVAASPALEGFQGSVEVNTIDSFQGQERDVVYISMVRSNSLGIIGFLSDIRRMNVAMTRARKKLVVVGDSATLSRHPFYEAFIAYCQQQEAYASAWEFMDL
jgi:superfamily I DNA and/or RNA helicase